MAVSSGLWSLIVCRQVIQHTCFSSRTLESGKILRLEFSNIICFCTDFTMKRKTNYLAWLPTRSWGWPWTLATTSRRGGSVPWRWVKASEMTYFIDVKTWGRLNFRHGTSIGKQSTWWSSSRTRRTWSLAACRPTAKLSTSSSEATSSFSWETKTRIRPLTMKCFTN